MNVPPIDVTYLGAGTFQALPRYQNVCAAHYGEGEIVTIAPVEHESTRTRNHYFVSLQEAFANLPDHLAAQYLSFDHFRKRGLIATGYRDERSTVCASKAEAQRIAAFIRPMDDYAVVTVSESVVTVYTAKSQKLGAMGKETFQRSKEDVLAWAAGLIGVEPSQLAKARAA